MDQSQRSKPTFIADQVWSLLTEFDDPWPHLVAAKLRAGRPEHDFSQEAASDTSDPWIEVDHDAVVAGHVDFGDGDSADLRRMVITTDSGLGKSKATEYLCYRLNIRGSGSLAVRLTFEDLKRTHSGILRAFPG